MTIAKEMKNSRTASRWLLPLSVLGSSLGFIDSSVVNIALPDIQVQMHMSLAQAQWVVNGYLLSLASLVLLGGAAGDRFGTLRVFIFGLMVFAISSVLCAFAASSSILVASRIVQGGGAAFLMPASLALLSQNFSGAQRARAIGIWAASGGVLMAFGPPLGGWLVSTHGWPSIFLINIPMAGAAILIACSISDIRKYTNNQKLDVVGAFLVVCALASTTYGLIRLGEGELSSGITALVVAVPLFWSFILFERDFPSPMIPLSLFQSRTFSGLNLLTVMLYGALGATIFLLPYSMVRVHHYSAVHAGLAFIPLSLTFGIGSMFADRFIPKLGVRKLLISGPIVMAVGFAVLAVEAGAPAYTVAFLPGLLLIGIGLTLTVPALTNSIFDSITSDQSGTASGINNAAARTGGLLATAGLGIAFNGGSDVDPSELLAAYVCVMWTAAVLAAGSSFIARSSLGAPE